MCRSSNITNYRLLECIVKHFREADGEGRTLADALYIVSAVSRSGLAVLPRTPTPEMLKAGAEAAGISEGAAAIVYHAMLAAEQ